MRQPEAALRQGTAKLGSPLRRQNVLRKAALVAWVMGLALGAPALAASTGNVTVTVTVEYLSISVSSDPVAFGMVALDSKTATAVGNKVVVTNDGDLAENFSIHVSAGTTATWILGTTGKDDVAENKFTLCGRFVASAGAAPAEGDYVDGDVLVKTATWCDGTLFGGKGHEVAATAACDLYFRLHAPTSVTGAGAGSEHSLTVEVAAQKHTP